MDEKLTPEEVSEMWDGYEQYLDGMAESDEWQSLYETV